MKESAPPRARGLIGRLAISALAVSLLLLGQPRLLSENHLSPFYDELVELGASDGTGHLSSELAIYKASVSDAPPYLLATIAVDEEFVERAGDDWELQVYEIIEGANALLRGVGLSIKVDSLQVWRSDDAEESIVAHLDSAGNQVIQTPGQLFIAIVCQETVKYDGWARPLRDEIITRFYHNHVRRNSSLIAHEVGHLLGAKHHEDDEECTEDGCIMDTSGYAHGTDWCEHHLEVIQKHIAARLQS